MSQKTGVNTSTIIKPKTKKQKKDRKKYIAEQKKQFNDKVGKLLGTKVYTCTSCGNRLRTSESLKGRNVLCKCNNGFFR